MEQSFVIKNSFKQIYKYFYNVAQRDKPTDHEILDLHTNIIKVVKNREKSCSIFLDFTKAFDTVNHDILHKKLKYYGICDLTLNCFKS